MTRADELLPRLLRRLRRRLDEGRFSVDDARALVLDELSRLPHTMPEAATRVATVLDKTLLPALRPMEPRSLYAFAVSSSRLLSEVESHALDPRDASARELAVRALSATALRADAHNGSYDTDAHVQRAVAHAIRLRNRGSLRRTRVKLEDDDPVRRLLLFAERGPITDDRRAIRTHLSKFARTDFGPVLRQAAAFAPDVLHDALGAELSVLCKPVGFHDAKKTTVLLEVSSSMAAQQVQFRAAEIVARLQRVEGFGQVTSVRVVR
jgi:hypothetical protein